VGEGPRLNHPRHGEFPCDPGEVPDRSLGLEERRRSELDGGGPAAAAEARAPANGWLRLINTLLGKVLWFTGKGWSSWVREEIDWNTVLTERRQWRTTEARAGTRAREGRWGLAYMRAGRSVGVGRNVPVPLGRVGRSRAWPATCAAPAANGTARTMRQPTDPRHLAPPLATDGTHGCSPALRSDQWSHRCLCVCALSGYGAYGGGRRGRARRRALDALRRSRCKCIS
jgi:hypothetical protein